MTRVKRGVTSHKRHKKILKKAKGYWGARSRTYRSAFQAVIKANQYSYRDRKKKKRLFRKLWITRINAVARQYGTTYSELINKLKILKIIINRKMLVDIFLSDKNSFDFLIKKLHLTLSD